MEKFDVAREEQEDAETWISNRQGKILQRIK
jgi:hypothetical protein